jgi:hypothetical protein
LFRGYVQTVVLSSCSLLLLVHVAGRAAGRTWTDASGAVQVEAKFVTAQFGKIWLLRSDGRVFGVELAELSKADQEYARRLIRAREVKRQTETTPNPPGRVPYAPGRELCRLESRAIDESSGLACSRRSPGFFWTHNDSGGDARVYLFDKRGRDLGSCQLQDQFAYDFEDMFSFDEGDKTYLVLCDVGNNGRAASVQMLHVVEEPPFDPDDGLFVDQVPVVHTIYVAYEDDHRDCEAVGIDPTSKTILFVTKEKEGACFVYSLKWPADKVKKALPARQIAKLALPAVTAMDISPDGRRAVVLTYGNAFEYVRGDGENWSQAFSRPPRQIVVPERVQGESICYGPDGKTLYLTSEKQPTPLIEVPAKGE